MGGKNSSTVIEDNNEKTKNEYFQAIRTDMKKTMNQINSLIHIESDTQNSEDTWVNFLRKKFEEYLEKNKKENKNFKRIFLYLDSIEETNESKHIFNLGIFLKKYHDESIKNKQKNSNLKI